MFDHTVVVAQDDPALETFKQMDKDGIIQMRVIPAVGAEMFARFVYDKIGAFVETETDGRVRVIRVEFSENNKNSSIYEK